MLRVDKNTPRELKRFLADLKKVDPEARKQLQRRFRAGAQKVAADARGRQKSVSGNLRKLTRAGARAGQAEVRSKAIYSRIREFGGRHLVFARPDSWVYDKAQPAVFPAVEAHRDEYIKDANEALFQALRGANFK